MSIRIIATHSCNHRPILERELRDMGYDYEVVFVEENPDVAARYGIRHSPNLVVGDTVVCRGPVTEGEIRQLIEDAMKSRD